VSTARPSFSIVIPTYARPCRKLAACLESCSQLDYPRDRFEVIVVDDGSEHVPEDVTHPFLDRMDLALLTQQHAGPAAARNTGAAQAKGEFLAFTDDDCSCDPDWLNALANRFADLPDWVLGGKTMNALPTNVYSAASQLLIGYLYTYYNSVPEQARFFTTNNLAVAAEGFRAVGGFDTLYIRAAAEEREFCDRWSHHGRDMAFVPEAVIHHFHTLSLSSFWRQHFDYGRGAYQFRQARACRDASPIRFEPASFYLNLLRYPFGRRKGVGALSVMMLLVVSQVANAAGFFRERARDR
jgi:GT2 family glycosyltransferase